MVLKREPWGKLSLIHYQDRYDKIERNLNKGKFGLGKRYF